VFRLDEEFLGDDFCLVLVLFDWPHSTRDDFLSDVIYCHSGVPQGRHIGPLFFINNVDEVFRMFQHVYALGYADDLKLFKTIVSIDDCHRFQSGLDRLQEWCSG
jgi:hypothetical protein